MSRRAQENLIAGAFLLAFLGVIALSLDFGPRARMIPLPLAAFGAILALVQLVWQNFGSTDALKMDMIQVQQPLGQSASEETPARGGPAATGASPGLHSPSGAYAIVFGLLLLILAIGPLPAVFLFTAGYFVRSRYCAPLPALLYATAVTTAIYLLFFVALQIQPYHGLLAPLVAHFE